MLELEVPQNLKMTDENKETVESDTVETETETEDTDKEE